MKLHLPKGLFIAVLAACAALMPTTYGADTISVNFTGNEPKKVTSSSTGTLGGVNYEGWNNIACSAGTSTLKDNKGNQQAATLVLGYVGTGELGTWHSNQDPNGTVTGDVQRGYIDVWNNKGENHYTIALTHNYWVYDSVFYMSGDSGSGATFAPMEVNGTAYIGGTDVQATNANKAWGAGYTNGCTEFTDNNRITVTNQEGNILLATNVWNSTTSRATLAGLQVIDKTAETFYFATLGSGETATADASWSLNGAAATPYANIGAAAKYLGVVADAAGSTLNVAAGDSIKFLGLKENNLTIASDGAISIAKIITNAGTAMNITAGLTGSRMDIYGDGTLNITGDASGYNGLVNIHGSEVTIENSETSFALGGTITNNGTLNLNSNVLVADKNLLDMQLKDSSGNVVNGFAGNEHTLNRLIATGTGSVTLQEGSKVYYGAKDTTGLALSAGSSSIYVNETAESGVYYVSSGQSVNISNVSLGEGQSLDKFYVSGKLNINSTTLPGGKSLQQILTQTVGSASGSLVLSTNFGDSDNVKLGSGSSSQFRGSLEITGSGTTLYLGSGEKNTIDFSSFSQILLNKGGKIQYQANGNSTFNNITVEEGTGEFHSRDNDLPTVGIIQFAGQTHVATGATLNITANWNAQFNVQNATGAGDVNIYSADSNSNEGAEEMQFKVASLKDFYGNLTVYRDTMGGMDIDIHTGIEGAAFKSLVLNHSNNNTKWGTTYDFHVESDTALERIAWEKGTTTINAGKTLTVGKQGVNSSSSIGTLTGEGVLEVTGTGTMALNNVSNSVTFKISDNATLNLSSNAALDHSRVTIAQGASATLTGSGTYTISQATLNAGQNADSSPTGIKIGADWSGQVNLVATRNDNHLAVEWLNLNHYGDDDSTIKLKGVSGYLCAANGGNGVEFTSDIIMENSDKAALELTDGWAGDHFIFSGTIKNGSNGGNLIKDSAMQQDITFSGNISGWTGVIDLVEGGVNSNNNKISTISFTGDATTINNTIRTRDVQVNGQNEAQTVKATVRIENGNAVTVNGAITHSNTNSSSELNLEVDTAKGTTFSNTVNVSKIKIDEDSSATFTNSVSTGMLEVLGNVSFTATEALSVSKLEMQQGAEVSVSKEGAVGTLTVEKSATFNGGNVNANLTLADNATVTINDAVALGSGTQQQNQVLLSGDSTVTAYTLSLGSQLTLQGLKLDELGKLAPGSGEVILFKGVDTLNLGGVEYTVGDDVLTAASGVKLSDYFKNDSIDDQYYIGFNANGDVYAGLIVPEPATATLSLLALAGLCARRRRASH